MVVKIQKKVEFVNNCNCIVDFSELEAAMLWFTSKPVSRLKRIFMHGRYPAVAIYKIKIHVHRLLAQYWSNRVLSFNEHVHHVNGNKLDASKSNLEIVIASEHMSQHNSGKTLSAEHRLKISNRNRLRKGIQYPHRRGDVKNEEIYNLRMAGLSFNAISIKLNMEWHCVKIRFEKFVHDNPELVNQPTGGALNTMIDPGAKQTVATEDQAAINAAEDQANTVKEPDAEEGNTEG